ncbi:MAG: hypothetical protein ABJC12_13775 [Saprospiraceae bacterium]
MRISFFFSLICFCLVLATSCEKADIQKTSISDNEKIQSRNVPDDCDNCPVNDCCCLIQLTEGNTTLDICGSSSPLVSATPCSAGAGTCVINGYLLSTTLNAGGTPSTYHFCMAKGVPFCIQSSNAATARITCQAGSTSPQTVTVNFNTPGNKAYYTVNGSCELIPCL